jgi:hypothetical protein
VSRDYVKELADAQAAADKKIDAMHAAMDEVLLRRLRHELDMLRLLSPAVRSAEALRWVAVALLLIAVLGRLLG